MSEPQEKERLQEHFADADHNHAERWDSLWKAGDFLPWDRGQACPALEDTLIEKTGLIGESTVSANDGQKTRKKALVPGCGRGYDVLLLSSFGYDSYGLELSETALKRALEEQEKNAHKYAARDPKIGKGTVHFLNGDFFDNTTWKQGGSSADDQIARKGAFDLIFDYTVRRKRPRMPYQPAATYAQSQLTTHAQVPLRFTAQTSARMGTAHV